MKYPIEMPKLEGDPKFEIRILPNGYFYGWFDRCLTDGEVKNLHEFFEKQGDKLCEEITNSAKEV